MRYTFSEVVASRFSVSGSTVLCCVLGLALPLLGSDRSLYALGCFTGTACDIAIG
jgi:hypothetical protein